MEFRLLLKRLLQMPSQGLLGIDIGTNSIKLLKINSQSHPFLIEHAVIQSIPEHAVVNGEIVNHAQIADTLKTIIQNENITSKNVALAIPYSSTITKTIVVDQHMTADDIEMRVWVEANHLFPDLVGNIYLDFTILGPSAENKTQTEVMLVVCRKDIIKPYLEILRLASLTPKVIDVSSYALNRALSAMEQPTSNHKMSALLNLDFYTSTFIVVQNNQIVYTYDQSFDGQRLLQQVKKYQADNTTSNIDTDTKYLDILRENLSAHLRHTIHFFYSSRPNIVIDKMLLSGDCALLPSITTIIQQEINMNTEIATPFINMSIKPGIDKQLLESNSAGLMLCCGLALSTYS